MKKPSLPAPRPTPRPTPRPSGSFVAVGTHRTLSVLRLSLYCLSNPQNIGARRAGPEAGGNDPVRACRFGRVDDSRIQIPCRVFWDVVGFRQLLAVAVCQGEKGIKRAGVKVDDVGAAGLHLHGMHSLRSWHGEYAFVLLLH